MIGEIHRREAEILTRLTKAKSSLLNALRALPEGEIRSGCVVTTKEVIKSDTVAALTDIKWLLRQGLTLEAHMRLSDNICRSTCGSE